MADANHIASGDRENLYLCSKCSTQKSATEFYRRKSGKIHSSLCRPCKNAADRDYRAANLDKVRAAQKERRDEKAALVSQFGREALLTLERLKELFHYDPETGKFSRLTSAGGAHIGDEPGYTHEHGYRIISIGTVKYRAHRLAWFYMKGEWPKEDVDHRNTIPDDNRWENLREATDQQNLQNQGMPAHNTSGLKGANWHKEKQKWRATIQSHGKWRFLGYFATKEEAHAAYCRAAQELNGEFANFGEKKAA